MLDALPMELADAELRRPLLVTDQGIRRAGLLDRAIGKFQRAPAVFDAVAENPVFANGDAAAALYRSEACDCVVALGGGSVIDVAKFVSVLATHGGVVADYAGVADARIGGTAPLVAVPTTAGTGSEANGTAGIHRDPQTIAVGIFSRHVLPNLVILDPDMTRSLPARLTAATGIDALSHCIEGYLSANDIPFFDAIALDGIIRVVRYLARATADGADIEARTNLLLAGYAGGVAINMGLGPAHAIAISCGDQGFHHGILSGIGLVVALDHMASHRPDRAAAIRRAMELGQDDSLATAIADMMRDGGLPTSLAELGYVVDHPERLAREAHQSFFNTSAFHHPRLEEYDAMIRASAS